MVQCAYCKHYDSDAKNKPSCAAFVGRIPVEIIRGDFDHSDNHPNDNGLTFSPKKGTPKGIWKKP
jgi:hypothetical protein